jgi:hypothetical protein
VPGLAKTQVFLQKPGRQVFQVLSQVFPGFQVFAKDSFSTGKMLFSIFKIFIS